ncbi:MAG: beta-ureidopropionase / N-carbamoyl-L-amino-acid hydrolase [Clostridia bacterium]|jgi:N-carbamoyl-L-amino-acid hydrolase|nr:beta-ureidopropionase / N-carbamoyl-L-amino-acid hydrolase [Clostridia bacterium]MDN5322865.1 beta-ureidopropionase / N-carbamoyl-L-amino-acid hydrolase [Clostridia bacterium]
MKVNKERLKQDFDNIARFGKLDNGGVTRLAFSEEDLKARQYLLDVMKSLNLKVSIDAFGNIRGRREGQFDLPPVMIGSHLDTVPNGGHYDGVIGVIGALEVIRVLNENNIVTKRPIEVINFSCEESSRFRAGTLGSKVMVGKFTKDKLKTSIDKDGISLYDALKQAGYDPDRLEDARINNGDIYAFMEMHIEQGPVLEQEKYQVGIVTAIAAPTRFKVLIEGRADHSGNTPMNMRKDALTGASALILGVEQIAKSEAGERTVGTVGYVYVEPGAMNVVPGKVELGIDIRDINSTDKKVAVKKVIDLIHKIQKQRNLEIKYEILADEEPVVLSNKIISCLENEAKKYGFSYKLMPSGAGHDAMYMTNVTNVGMIFIPSINGVSHNIAEFSRMEDIKMGTDLLLKATIKLAQEECE